MIVDKKKCQGGKTKLIFENLIWEFVCWWNLHLNMPDYLNPFMPSGNRRTYKPAAFRCRFVQVGMTFC